MDVQGLSLLPEMSITLVEANQRIIATAFPDVSVWQGCVGAVPFMRTSIIADLELVPQEASLQQCRSLTRQVQGVALNRSAQ